MINAIFACTSDSGENVRIWWHDRRAADQRTIDRPLLEFYSAGRDNLMVIAAVRYCIGRMTYIVSDCADWLIGIWPALPEKTRSIIQRDIDEAFASDDEARKDGSDYKPLGNDCDRAEWEKARRLWK